MAQGVITGVRGLCNGLGPALYGFIFYLFHIDMNDHKDDDVPMSQFNQSDSGMGYLHHLHEVCVR